MTDTTQTQDAGGLAARLAEVQARREQDLARYGRAVRDLEWTRRELALREKEHREASAKAKDVARRSQESRVGLPEGWLSKAAVLRAEERGETQLDRGPLATLSGALMLHFARRAARRKNYGQAEVFYQAALLFDPRPFLWRQLGNMQSAHGLFHQAVASFDRALQDAPGDAESWFVKGQALMRLGDKEDSEAAFAEALKLDPQLADRDRD